jgi:hypothetical protein
MQLEGLCLVHRSFPTVSILSHFNPVHIVAELLNNFPVFYGTRRFISGSQEFSNGLYPEPL